MMVGGKGLDALDRFLLGSVSTWVVRHADCAVLIVRCQSKCSAQFPFIRDTERCGSEEQSCRQ